MSRAIEPKDILKVYKSNYDEMTYRVVCLTLENQMLTEENERLRQALEGPDLADTE